VPPNGRIDGPGVLVINVVTALEVLGLLLVAAGAGLGVATYVAPWAGLLTSGACLVAAAWFAERPMKGGDRGAAVRAAAPRS